MTRSWREKEERMRGEERERQKGSEKEGRIDFKDHIEMAFTTRKCC
jgi:hypothetical protein